ncbi:DNA-directed RNA polymerase sigma-70 factor [Parapedobacter pyrenivorans]|uniref:DNA-directed RNA polymerase sigma-70 factor n=1 Tax=Parapedobacter pyrenivorans TaxID=1305674 RepID=A0A917I1P9_9SPHI|nr:sigma-70 family RNA polymerase sigma factor [Parapedobacter pyrenivorans]GGH01878.1 DNA-directed RNA polymerase sigma-70 factor [Parapedobacter pyrenivorans]
MDFEYLYKLYSPKIFRVCLGYFNDADKAKDVTQDTFVTVFEHLKSLKNTDNMAGWIYRIASNKCLRQLENEKKSNLIYDYDFSHIEDTETAMEEGDFAKLHKYISELTELDRIIIGLYLEEVNQEKIAEIVGLSHANVRVKIHRIKETLSKKMKSDAY